MTPLIRLMLHSETRYSLFILTRLNVISHLTGRGCTLMTIDPGDRRQHALDCVRLAQTATTPEARSTWSDLAKTWLRFASDLEVNECLLDEWGKPRPKKDTQRGVTPIA
jgi:hypothetical protein